MAAASGVLSGTPTNSGTFTFTVRFTDTHPTPATATKAFSLTINATPSALTITTGSPLPKGTVGAAYSQALTASGGTSPYTWSVSAGTPPTGLTLNASSGVIAGTPSGGGTFTFT